MAKKRQPKPAETPLPDPSVGGDLFTADMGEVKRRRQIVAAQHEQLKADKLAGLLIDRTIAERALLGLASMFVGEIEDLEKTAPDRLSHREPGQVQRDIRVMLDSMRSRIVARAKIELADMDARVRAKLTMTHGGKRRGLN